MFHFRGYGTIISPTREFTLNHIETGMLTVSILKVIHKIFGVIKDLDILEFEAAELF